MCLTVVPVDFKNLVMSSRGLQLYLRKPEVEPRELQPWSFTSIKTLTLQPLNILLPGSAFISLSHICEYA